MSIVDKTEIGGTTGNYALDVYVKGGSSNPFILKGKVTTATSSTVFASTELIGYGNDAFKDWEIWVFYDTAGTDAAPQGEKQPISDYVSSTGTFTHTAFTADLSIDDVVLILHPYEATGGDATEAKQDTIISDIGDVQGTGFVTADDSLHALSTELDEILNLTDTHADIPVSGETNLYIDDAPSKIINGMSIKIDTTDMGAGDTYEFKVYYRVESAGSYIQQDPTITYTGAQSAPLKILGLEPYRYGCKVTGTKTAGTNRSFPIEAIREA